jgi:glycosyltransferase involved in cell wall biosynthesis
MTRLEVAVPSDANHQSTKFSIVTPCWNAEDWILETLLSVVNQTAVRDGRATLEYIIRDGASSDRTVEIVNDAIDSLVDIPGVKVTLTSEPDSGMYDALSKGFESADGDIVAYLNAGDLYSPTCFDAVLDAMAIDSVEWVTGLRVLYNAAGHVVDVRLPGPYRADLMLAGYYGRRGRLGSVQQESTFWSARLQASVDLDMLKSFRLAGDAYLWNVFVKQAPLIVLYAHLGGFRLHGGHLSDDMSEYHREMDRFLAPATLRLWLVSFMSLLTMQLPLGRKILAGKRMVAWSRRAERYEHTTFRSRFLSGRHP